MRYKVTFIATPRKINGEGSDATVTRLVGIAFRLSHGRSIHCTGSIQ